MAILALAKMPGVVSFFRASNASMTHTGLLILLMLQKKRDRMANHPVPFR